jgi:hypothetical protein
VKTLNWERCDAFQIQGYKKRGLESSPLLKIYVMKLFKNSLLAPKNIFSPQIRLFFRPVALLCGSKKALSGTKI